MKSRNGPHGKYSAEKTRKGMLPAVATHIFPTAKPRETSRGAHDASLLRMSFLAAGNSGNFEPAVTATLSSLSVAAAKAAARAIHHTGGSNMSTQANMNKLVEQLTRVADALEKQNALEIAFQERMYREQEAEEKRMQGLPSEPDDDPLLH